MKQYGLIGFPLGHSFSQGFFTEKFRIEGLQDHTYSNYPLSSIDEFPALIASFPELSGLNVTIPYKQAVIPYLDEIDPLAESIGAVNCIRITRGENGASLKGYNTDMQGFEASLVNMIGKFRPDSLILGTGGASKAVACALGRLGIQFRFVSRTGDGIETLSYTSLNKNLIQKSPLIINTTPLGTYPDIELLPAIPYEGVGRSHYLHDLVYNPPETAFLRQGRLRGATVKNGYAMLVGQAESSWEIWNAQS